MFTDSVFKNAIDNKYEKSTAVEIQIMDTCEAMDVKQNDKWEAFDTSIKCEYGNPQDPNKMGEAKIKMEREPFQVRIEFIDDPNNYMDDVCSDDSDDNDNPSLSCEECREEYKEYCSTCPMLLRIFHNISKVADFIPNHILEIKEKLNCSDTFGIFALKPIPKNVIFGPFTGLISINRSNLSLWKMKNNKLICDKTVKRSNWMRYINNAETTFSNNLDSFQFNSELYYRTNQSIAVGRELLISFSEESITKSSNCEETYLSPSVETESESVYACILCCLGFSVDKHLLKHKTICPYRLEDTDKNDLQKLCPDIAAERILKSVGNSATVHNIQQTSSNTKPLNEMNL